MRPLLIYIHGFISSPLSEKAQELQGFVAQRRLALDLAVPQLSNYPGEAFAQLDELLRTERARGRQQIALIGSSLGGFWATVLAERYRLRAVLVNPAVEPHKLAALLQGEHENLYTGERFCLSEAHVAELRELAPARICYPQQLWLLQQMGDETLDYRQAVAYYRDCQQLVEPGGNHRFEGFVEKLPAILQFLQLPTAA